jgi:peptide/nickel transport system permease protein
VPHNLLGRGLSGRTVLCGHALRNALLPFLTLVGTHPPELVGGAVLVETVFSLPGLGAVTVQAALGAAGYTIGEH